MKVKILALILIIVVAFTVFYLYQKQNSNNKNTFYQLSGKVDNTNQNLSFRVSGRIMKILKDEGDFVAKDELLAILDDAPLQAQKQVLIANLKAVEAQNQLAKNGNDIEQINVLKQKEIAAKAQVDYANSFLKKQQTLYASRATSLNNLETAKNALFQAQSALNATNEELKLAQKGTRKESIESSNAQVEQVKAQIAALDLQINDTKLFANQDGVIATKVYETGEMVNAGMPIFSIMLHKNYVRAFIDANLLNKISLGQDILLKTDDAKEFKGKISFISPISEFTPKYIETVELRSDLVYRIRISIDDENFKLAQGTPISVIINNQEANAVNVKEIKNANHNQ